MRVTRRLVLTAEVDVDLSQIDEIGTGSHWVGSGPHGGILVDVTPSEEGHGFGLTKALEVAVTIGTAVSAELIAEAIRAAVKGNIRRIRYKSADRLVTRRGCKTLSPRRSAIRVETSIRTLRPSVTC